MAIDNNLARCPWAEGDEKMARYHDEVWSVPVHDDQKLGKGARAINQNVLVFTNDNIDKLLMERHIGAKVRRGGGRTKGPAMRTKEDDDRFELAFVKLLERDNK